MLRISLFLCWILSASVLYIPPVYPVFGVKVSIGANSQITSFVCYLNNGRVLSKKRVVDRDTFVKIVSGYWPSVYNPKRIDFFKENNIDCALILDSITLKPVVGCVPMDSLWKIRFSTYPFKHNPELGWSNKYHKPSPGQEQYLFNRYGVRNVDAEYFLDTSFWMLMNDVTDTDWILNYSAIN